MNVISYEYAYCLFPVATLEERASLLSYSSQGRSKRRAEGLVKYSARGFQMLDSLSLTDLESPRKISPFTFGPRWIGDRDTWVIRLDTHGIPAPPPPNPYSVARSNDPVALASFSVRYDVTEGAIMDFSIVESPVLKYAYVFGDTDTIDYLARMLEARRWEEEYQVVVCELEDWQ